MIILEKYIKVRKHFVTNFHGKIFWLPLFSLSQKKKKSQKKFIETH